MKRRKFLGLAGFITTISIPGVAWASDAIKRVAKIKFRRVRPTEVEWPSPAKWDRLRIDVNGNLIKIESPLWVCRGGEAPEACNLLFNQLKNPYFIGDQPALTQTSGWIDAWSSSPSVYAVAATQTADDVAALNFARLPRLRPVVKGGGHSYQGTSNAPDSLLIWTRKMDHVELHEQFVPDGATVGVKPQPAVSIQSGAIWMHVYNQVTTVGGRYVQGGGCATVGVAGLIQSGGFGSFSKHYGLAAAGLIEAEIVIADGSVLTVNANQHSDLLWALKGGGGGSFGVVTRLTLRTRELPVFFGAAFGAVKAASDEAFKNLIEYTMSFYREHLFNPQWGEQIRFRGNNTMQISMMFQGLTADQAKSSWHSFQTFIDSRPEDYTWAAPLNIAALPASHMWDPDFLAKYASKLIARDNRENAPSTNVYWAGDGEESGQFLHAYHSAWLPEDLLEKQTDSALARHLFAASRHWTIALHFNKGLAGGPNAEIEHAKDTATNPAVLTAFALAIIAGGGDPAFVGLQGHEPDQANARRNATAIDNAFNELKQVLPAPASYVSESDFFEKDWQQAFWGSNYKRLLKIKQKYDPNGLFFVHHGVGSEGWSDDGFTRL